MRWSDISIRSKLILGLGSLVILALFINYRFGKALSDSQHSYVHLIEGPIKLGTLMEDASAELNHMHSAEKSFLITQDLQHAADFNQTGQRLLSRLDEALQTKERIKETIADASFDPDIQIVVNLVKSYIADFDRVKAAWETKGLDHNSGLRGSMRSAVHRTEEIFKRINEPALMVELLMLRRHEKDYLIRGLEKYPTQWLETKEGLLADLNNINLKSSARTEVTESLAEYDTAFKALQDQDTLIKESRQKLSETVAKVLPLLQSVKDESLQFSQTQQSETTAIADERKTNLYIFAAFVALLFIICGYIIATGITRPLQTLMISIDNLEAGNLTHLPETKSKDEIGRVSAALRRVILAIQETFNTDQLDWNELAAQQRREQERIEREREEKRILDEKVSHTQEILAAAASGDLRKNVTIEGEDAMGRVGAHLRSLMGTLQQDIGQIGQQSTIIKDASRALDEVSTNINHQLSSTNGHITDTNHRVNEVNGNLQNVATAIEEMNACIGEIARSAEHAESIAETAVKEAKVSAEIISRLKEHGDQISQMADEIGKVAEQTNLLSLNASIEAERAGESGRGFRVVASEVKELARNTGTTTDKIRNNVNAIQQAMGHAVESVERINGVVEQIFDIQRTIASSVEEQSVTTSEIMNLITQSATDSNEIANLMGQVQVNAEETGNCVNQANEVILQLGSLSDSLQSMMSKFKISA